MRTLTSRELGRATLARNLLLEHTRMAVPDAVAHLIGLQAQEPQEPYLGLFARLAGFDPLAASDMLQQRVFVRTLAMRRTLHLLTRDDCLALRPLLQPVLTARNKPLMQRFLVDVDDSELARLGDELFSAAPLQLGEFGRAVHERWPGAQPVWLGLAATGLVPLVQVPPRGLWRQEGPARNTTFAAWLGRQEPDTPLTLDDLVRRYLAAFGPATTADIRAWSGLTGLPAVLKRLTPELVRYTDEKGRVLYDLPGAPLPDPDAAPAPPRFVPAFDNVVLGYDDRSRVIDDEHRRLSVTGARFLLVDGRVTATWTSRVEGTHTTLAIQPLVPLRRSDEIDAEATKVAGFLTHPGGTWDIRWEG